MLCRYTCTKCGKRFDKFSGQLINLSDTALNWFYNLQSVKELFKTHKHVILCADCLVAEHGPLLVSDFKLKNKHHMTSNLCYVAVAQNNKSLLERVKQADVKGVSSLNINFKTKNQL